MLYVRDVRMNVVIMVIVLKYIASYDINFLPFFVVLCLVKLYSFRSSIGWSYVPPKGQPQKQLLTTTTTINQHDLSEEGETKEASFDSKRIHILEGSTRCCWWWRCVMPSSFLPWHMGTFVVVVEVVSPRFSFFFFLHPRPPTPRASCETIPSTGPDCSS